MNRHCSFDDVCDECHEVSVMERIEKMPCYARDCGDELREDGTDCALGDSCVREMARKEYRDAMRDM